MLKNTSEYAGQTMKQIVASRLALNPNGINYSVTASLSPQESKRNQAITANLNQKNYAGNTLTRVVLPHDTKASQVQRDTESRRQMAEPWNSAFMYTATDKERLNNPAQISFMQQRQLTPPNTYGQFYAFMHALSAAFGSLHGES